MSKHNKLEFEFDLLKTSEVAEMIGKDIRTVTRWVLARVFPGTRKVDPNKRTSAYTNPRASVEAHLLKQRAQSSGEDDRAR